MSRNLRNKIGLVGIAFSLLVATGSSYWLYQSANDLQVGFENAAENRANGYAQRRDIIIEDRCLPLPRKEEAACINEEREASRQGYRDEHNLEAQRITATWTRHMGIAAIIGMAASLIGVGLVFFTFRATRESNDLAKRQMGPVVSDARVVLNTSHQNSNAHVSLSIIFTGPTEPDAITITVTTRLLGNGGQVIEHWVDSCWQKDDDWFEVIPFSANLVLLSNPHSVDFSAVNVEGATAEMLLCFTDAFGKRHRLNRIFSGSDVLPATIELKRVLT